MDDAKEKQAYLQRAQKGVDRLELILRQLQEATQLEKALEQVEVQPFDLCELLAFSLENYASIHPGLTFELQPCVACRISGSRNWFTRRWKNCWTTPWTSTSPAHP